MILGVTHKEDGTPIQRLTIGYKVSIGIPAKEGQNFPQKDDRFHIRKKNAKGEWEDDQAFTDQLQKQYMPEFQTEKGMVRAPLREFDIVFLSDNLDELFRTEYAWWATSEKKCSGDGRSAQRRFTALTADQQKKYPGQTMIDWTPCGKDCPEHENGKCKPSGQLFFIFKDRPIIGTVAEYTTTSYETIKRVHSSLLQIQDVTGGRLKGIPLKLVVRPGKTRYEDKDGKPKSGTAYFVNIEFRQEDYTRLVPVLLQQSVQYDRMLSAQRRLLAEHVEDDDILDIAETPEPEKGKAMTSEFYPDNRQETQPTPSAPATTTATVDVDKVKELAGKLGLNDTHVDMLFKAFHGEIEPAGVWLKELAQAVAKLKPTTAVVLEWFSQNIVKPEGLTEFLQKQQPAAEPPKTARAKKAQTPPPASTAPAPANVPPGWQEPTAEPTPATTAAGDKKEDWNF